VSTEPQCGAATVWYSFTPAANGRVVFDTLGSDYDTMLGVFSGTPANLSWITCADNDSSGMNEQVAIEVTAGTTYYIEAGTSADSIDGQVGPGGTLSFHVSEAPPAMHVGATIGRRGVVTRFGAARVRGSLVCRPDATWADVNVSIRQRQGHRIVTAWASKSVPCTAKRQSWTVRLDNDVRAFRRKAALVTVWASACDAFTCDDATRQRAVRLGSHF
jgi:hypothetical protein